jgi:hypothetical protein
MWADGVNRTPPVLFTFDPSFRTDWPNIEKRQQHQQQLNYYCKKFNIDPTYIVCVGASKGEKRTYVSESPALVRRFFAIHRVSPHGVIICSDNGSAFKEKGKDIFPSMHFQEHVEYPASVHQYLSPNDNRLHGVAKSKWRRSRYYFKRGVSSSLKLLHCLDEISPPTISSWFRANFLMDKKKLDPKDVMPIISSNANLDIFHQKCISEFQQFKRAQKRRNLRSSVVYSE